MTQEPGRAIQIASTRINCSKSKKFSISFKKKVEISDDSEKSSASVHLQHHTSCKYAALWKCLEHTVICH